MFLLGIICFLCKAFHVKTILLKHLLLLDGKFSQGIWICSHVIGIISFEDKEGNPLLRERCWDSRALVTLPNTGCIAWKTYICISVKFHTRTCLRFWNCCSWIIETVIVKSFNARCLLCNNSVFPDVGQATAFHYGPYFKRAVAKHNTHKNKQWRWEGVWGVGFCEGW